MKKLLLVGLSVVTLALTSVASAQFNRTGTVGSAALSYVQVNAPNTSSWQGVDLTAVIPIGYSNLGDKPLNFISDVQMQFIQTHGWSGSGQNVGTVGAGVTGWLNFDLDKTNSFALQPYVRLGIQGNSGNFASVNQHYTAYNVEPGVVAKFGNFYGLAAYQYGEGFNSEFGSVINMPKVGLGIDLTKNFAIEARYEMNQGSYNFDRTVVGLTYKF